MSNIRQSGRVRKTVDYTFSEFDQEIMDAVDRDKANKRAGVIPQCIASTRGIRQSKRRRMLYNDSDSDSNYDPGSPMVEPQIPKHPERHVYLRRHENGVENGNGDDVKVSKQEVDLKSEINDNSARGDTVLPSDNGVHDGTSVEYNKLSNNSDTFDDGISPPSSGQNGESASMNKITSESSQDLESSVNAAIQTSDTSSVEIKKPSEKSFDTIDNDSNDGNLNNQVPEQAKDLVNTKIQDSDTSSQIGHSSSNNICSSVSDEEILSPNKPREDTFESTIKDAQIRTSTENTSNDNDIANSKPSAPVESNCNMLNSRDVNLLAQENKQSESIQKTPDHFYGSQTSA